MKKRIFSLVLALCMMISFMPAITVMASTTWDGTAKTDIFSGSGTVDKPYNIDSAEKLALLADIINGNTYFEVDATNGYVGNGTSGTYTRADYAAASYKLTANIELNDNTENYGGWGTSAPANAWTPIGTTSNCFAGTFDGNNCTISGIYYHDEGVEYIGLFGYSTGSIQNVNLQESYISGKSYVGGVVGYNYGGTVENCCNSGIVCGSQGTGGYNYGSSYAGGVAGYNCGGTVLNCGNTGTINGTGNNIGGVVGYTTQAEALVSSTDALVSGCWNTGSVNGTRYFGGVVGENYLNTQNSNDEMSLVENCWNSGTVTGLGYMGGVIGQAGSFWGIPAVKNCYNIGTVNGQDTVGGVIGRVFAVCNNEVPVSNCYNAGSIFGNYDQIGGVVGTIDDDSSTITVSDCYNSGSITIPDGSIGSGVVGKNHNGTIINCYYDKQMCAFGGIFGSDTAGSAEGKLTYAMTSGTGGINSGDAFYGFDPSVWTFTDGLYPRLTGMYDTDAAYVSAAPVFLDTTSDTSYDAAVAVNSSFTVSTENSVSWSSDKPDSIGIDPNASAATVAHADSSTDVGLTATRNGVSRKVNLMVAGLAPSVLSYFPANGATDMDVDTQLKLTFSENVTAVSGENNHIYIKKTSDDTMVQALAADSENVSVSGKIVTVTLPQGSLKKGVNYYILIENNAFKNNANYACSGITDKTVWTFKTLSEYDFVITRGEAPQSGTVQTDNYYVYQKNEDGGYSPMCDPDNDSNTGVFSSMDDVMNAIHELVSNGRATLSFGLTGTNADNLTGTLDLDGDTVYLGSSGTYTVKGSLISNADDTGVINLNGASLVVESADIESTYKKTLVNQGSGSITVNSGTVKRSGDQFGQHAILIKKNSTGDTIINGGKITTGSGNAIHDAGSGNVSISGSDTLVKTDAEGFGVYADNGIVNVSGGTISGIYGVIAAEAHISAGKLEGTVGPALYCGTGNSTISGGTLTSNNSATHLDMDGGIIPGTVLVAPSSANTKLVISGGTIENTSDSGYAVYNYYDDSNLYTSSVYLSGTPTISGATNIWTNTAIHASDGASTSPVSYTGGVLTLEYGGTITADSTVVVSDVTNGTNDGKFSLTNHGYYLKLSGTDLATNTYPAGYDFDSLTYMQFYAVPSAIGDWNYTMYSIAGTEMCNNDFENGTEFFQIKKSVSNSQALYCNSNSGGYIKVSSNVGEFHLISFALQNADNPEDNTESIDSFKIIGYRGNNAVDGAAQTVQAAYGNLATVNLTGSSWYNIDQFRIYPMHGDDHVNSFYFYFDDLVSGAPIIDTTSPTLSSHTPIDGATTVAVNMPLALTFSEAVTPVSGKNISIIKASDNSTIQTIAANDSTQVSVSGNVVTITPSSSLDYSTKYYILIDSGAFKDASGNTYSGISNTTAWSFTTASNTTYAITYDSNGATSGSVPTDGIAYAQGTAVTAKGNTGSLAKTGYIFFGWNTKANGTGTAVSANGSFTVTGDTTLYAQWTKNATYTVSGQVTPYPATVTIKYGQQTVGSTLTDSSGNYSFSGLPAGTYNVVGTDGTNIKTEIVTVTNADISNANIIISANSSILNVMDDTPPVVVGGLDAEAAIQNATITMTVEEKSSSSAIGFSKIGIAANGQTVDTYLDVQVTKTDLSGTSALLTLSNVVEIIVPYDFTGKTDVTLYRYHGTEASVMTKVNARITSIGAGEDGKYYLDTSNGYIYIYANKFSTYAIAYTVQQSNGGGSTRHGGGSVSTSYTITSSAGEGGSISPSSANVTGGASKTFTVTANEGYNISDVLVDGASVGAVSSYTFSNVSSAHTIKAVFAEDKGLPYYVDDKGNSVFIGFASDASGTMKYLAPEGKTVLFKVNTKNFTDISGHWAKSYIDFVTEREIFLGTSSNAFSPNTGMTRAMFATAIGRLYERSYGKIATAGTANEFTDVGYSLYYGNYVGWATQNGIITGVGNGNFEPDREITRDEMAAILYRFANFLGVLPKDMDTALKYPDASTISNWADSAALYCQSTSIITGRDGGNFVPQGTATRAEVAAILQRFIDKTVK